MKIWKLTPKEGLPENDEIRHSPRNPWHPEYDTAICMVVRAATEERARAVADDNAGEENNGRDEEWNHVPMHPWLDSKLSDCVEVAVDGDEELLCRDVHES